MCVFKHKMIFMFVTDEFSLIEMKITNIKYSGKSLINLKYIFNEYV